MQNPDKFNSKKINSNNSIANSIKMSSLNSVAHDIIIDWDLILNLSEILDYLPTLDKIELSQLSKLFRLKLKPKLFRIIKFGQKPSDLVTIDKICSNDEMNQACINEHFIDGFPAISAQILELNLYRFFNVYKFLQISQTFINLQQIRMFKICLPLEIFRNSLQNLKKLRLLSLDQVTLVQFINDNIIGPLLNLPGEFNSLSLSDCYLIKSKLVEDPLKTSYNYGRQVISKDYLHLMDHQFPNLKSYAILGYKHSISPILSSFLAKHPDISKLKISSNLLNQQILTLISTHRSVYDLTFEDFGIDLNLEIPQFSNVKKFNYITYQSQFNWKIIEFYLSMTNLTSLTMNYYKNFYELMETLLRLLPNLENLKVFNNYCGGDLEFDQMPQNTLKTLDLLNFKQKTISLQLFQNSPKLQKLRIYKSQKYTLIGIKYSKSNGSEACIDKYFKFWNYRNYFTISPSISVKFEVLKFDKIYFNLHYLGEFNNGGVY
jgi:hypothetical protein